MTLAALGAEVGCGLCGGALRRWTVRRKQWQSSAIARGGAGGGGGGTASAMARCGRRLLVDLLYKMKQEGQGVARRVRPEIDESAAVPRHLHYFRWWLLRERPFITCRIHPFPCMPAVMVTATLSLIFKYDIIFQRTNNIFLSQQITISQISAKQTGPILSFQVTTLESGGPHGHGR